MARARHSMTYFLTMLLIFIVLSIISYLQKRSALVASTASTTTSTVPSSPSSFATGSNAHVTAQSNNHANANTVKVIDTRNGNGNVDGTCHQRTSSSASNNGGGQEGDSCIVSANDNNNNDSNDDNYIIIKKPYYGNDIISSQKTKTSKWTSESVLTTTTTTITHTPHGTYKHVFDYTDIKMDGNPNIEEIREVLDQHVENAIAGGETGISDEDYRMAKDKIIEQIDEEFSAQDTTTESKTRKFNEALASAKEALNALKEKNEKEAAAATKEAKISNTNEDKDYLQNKQKIFDIAPIIESGPYSASNTADTNTNSKHTKMKTASNNINTNKKQSLSRKKKALKHPRYFVNLATTRINDEVKYYYNHSKRWSQRVILEILYHQLRGIELHDTEVLENAFKNSLSGNLDQIDMDLPQFGFTEHPISGESIPFAMEVEKKLETWTSANSHECDWEGIACGFNHFNINRKEALKGMSVEEKEAYHERAEAKVKYNYQDCFCMEPELLKQITEEDVYTYDDDDYFDDDDDDDLYDGECNCPEGYITKREQPEGAVTHVILDGTDFIAFELPPDLANLPFLKSLVLIDNKFTGTMPTEFGSFRNLHELHLEGLFLKGDLPKELSMLNNTLESLILRDCNLSGKFPKALLSLTNLVRLDLSMNHFSGTIPSRISKMKNLEYLDLGKNDFFGTIPTAFGGLTNLKHLHFDHNSLHGNLPEELFSLRKLESINVEWNSFKGSFPQRIDKFKKLKRLVIGNNKFSGTLPENGWTGYEIISARKNSISGTIPKKIFSSTLKVLDLSQNELYGTIPKLSSSKKLNELYIDENNFSGDIDVLAVLPNETTIALEKNKLKGEVTKDRCVIIGQSSIPEEYPFPFPCSDILACPAGTFHENGYANYISGCIRCPMCNITLSGVDQTSCNYLGQTQCLDQRFKFFRGDMDGNGVLSPREILRLMYVLMDGRSWGAHYSKWAEMNVDECTLSGINCKGGKVTKIDLRGANLCSALQCSKLPDEIGELGESLEVLDLSRSNKRYPPLEIPSTIGKLTKLKIFDVSGNSLTKLPSEIGNMSSLQILNLSGCLFNRQIPAAIWKLDKLEKLNLNENNFSGNVFPSEIGRLTNLRELFLSQTGLEGTIPSEIGALTKLKNLEFFSNKLTGTVPSSLENLTLLKRVDFFNNALEGTIDFLTKLPDFEVIHLHSNKFSGSIPSGLGDLSRLTWLDITRNMLTGEIPASLASIPALKDLHLGDNYLQPPVPFSLCEKKDINNASIFRNHCSHIICPLGTYSAEGFASASKGTECILCDEDKTTIYLGKSTCIRLGQYEYLTMLKALIERKTWEFDENKQIVNDECDLEIVNCDDDRNVISLDIPLAGIEFNAKLFQG